MIVGLAKKFFGTVNDRLLDDFRRVCRVVNSLEDKYKTLTDEELQKQTQILKEKYQIGSTLDELLPDAYAICREASVRVLGMRHFDVQIMGGIALHRGMISEMVKRLWSTKKTIITSYEAISSSDPNTRTVKKRTILI